MPLNSMNLLISKILKNAAILEKKLIFAVYLLFILGDQKILNDFPLNCTIDHDILKIAKVKSDIPSN